MKDWACGLVCALVLLSPIAGWTAESPDALFARASSLYQNGDFESAERCLRQMVDAGIANGSVYYNLGNACFKQKKLGEAIYYWEKASQELPGDTDVRENLDFASLMLVDRIDTPQDPWMLRVLDRMVHFVSPRRESILALLLFFAANGMFALYLLSGNRRTAFRGFVASVALGMVALLLFCSLGWKVYERGHRLQGIIVEQKVDVRSGPGQENITVVTVHEGIKVNIRGEANGWYQVSLPNGWNGWLPRDCIRVL